MKNQSFSFLLVLCSFAIQAQSDWQLFRPDVQYLYANSNAGYTESSVLGVKIGTDSCTAMYPALRWYGDWECNEITSSFIGYEVCQTDSLTRFRLTDTDYFSIRHKADLGEQWPAWNWNDQTVWGRVGEIVLVDFLGLSDSIKCVYFFTIDENGEPTFLPAPGRPMKISKQYGLVEALWLRDFPDTTRVLPLIGLSEPSTGLQNPGKADIFSLQPGDELHIVTNNTVPLANESGFYDVRKALKATITDIQWNAQTQILRYFYSGSLLTTYSGSSAPDPDTIFQPVISDIWLNYLPSFDYLDAQPGSFWGQGGGATVCLENGFANRPSKFLAYSLSESEEGCFVPVTDDVVPIYYTEGLAGPYFDVLSLGGPSSRRIVYFRRDSLESGNPLDFSNLTAISDVRNSPNISVGPNPTSGPLHFQLPGDFVADLKLFDGYGRILLSENQARGSVEWNLSELPAGAYQVSALQEGRLVWRQLVLKQ